MTELARKIEPDLPDISAKRVELDLAKQKSKNAETDCSSGIEQMYSH